MAVNNQICRFSRPHPNNGLITGAIDGRMSATMGSWLHHRVRRPV